MSNAWHYKLKNAGNGYIVWDGESMVCDVFMTNDPKFAEDRARMIAAAPMTAQHYQSAQKDFDSIAKKLDTAERELFASCLLNEHYKEALYWILDRPNGCQYCDSGTLRGAHAEHDGKCGFAKAADLLGANEQTDDMGFPSPGSYS